MGNDLLSPIRLLFCGADIFMLYYFFTAIFSTKRNGKKIILISLIFTVIIFFENSFCSSTLNIITIPILYFIYAVLIFQISISNGIIYTIIFYAFISEKEMSFILIYQLLEKNLPFYFPPWYTSGGIYYLSLGYLAGFIVLVYIEKHIKKLEIANNNFSWYLLILPVLSYAVSMSFAYREFPDSLIMQIEVCFAYILLWLTDAVVFVILEKYTYIMNKIKYSELYTVKRKMENDHFQKIIKLNEHYRCYMHDIHTYFNSFRTLALDGENKKIVEIVDELEGEMKEKTSSVIFSSNPVLNAILSERMSIAKEKGIEMSLFVEKFLKVDFISDADMISMFGNVLDNAIEAAEKCNVNKRKVNVKLFMGNNYFLTFNIQNSYTVAAKKDGTRLLSTKVDSSHHGLGVGIVKSLVDKYGGTLSLEEKQDFFVTTLIISTYAKEYNFNI